MRRGSERLWFLRAVLCLVFLCGGARGGDPPAAKEDPYLADLRGRLERLKPEVEREIGRKLESVVLVVLPRERITEELIPWAREQLARIENGPHGEDLDVEARTTAEGGAEISLAHVDVRGRIVFPDLGDPESIFRLFTGLFPMSDFAKDPRALDLVLLHELVHVHQHRQLETPAFYASVRSRADLLARSAVLEGHAEYLTRRMTRRLGLGDLYEKYLARFDMPPAAKEFVRFEQRVAVADQLFAYRQGEVFVAAVIDRLGYAEAMERIYKSPPTLAAVSHPERYFQESEPSRWGQVAEDLRRWLARERGQATIEVMALPMVREMAGDAADGFREGFQLKVGLADVYMSVLVAEGEPSARALHLAWTQALERMHKSRMETGLFDEIRLSRKPDDWTLDYDSSLGHARQSVVREGSFVVDVSCYKDSEVEQGAERLARRAIRFLTDATWREKWMKGDPDLLKSDDPGLRLAAVSRMRRFVADEDWEVRWLGRFYEAKDERKDKTERIAALVSAVEDPDAAVITRGLLAFVDLRLWSIPWPLLRKRVGHEEATVRRAAWGLVGANSGDSDGAETLALVAKALDDPDVTVRDEAADCLSKLHDEPGLVEVFRKALKDRHWRVRQQALIILANCAFDFPELLPEISGLLDERPDVASKAIGQLGPAAESVLPRLREVLKGKKGRVEAAMAIWRIAGDVEPLLLVVSESVAAGKPNGVSEVGSFGSLARPVAPDIAKVLGHENRWMRITAAEALGKIGGPEAKEALTRRLDVEKDPKVLDAIRKAIESLHD